MSIEEQAERILSKFEEVKAKALAASQEKSASGAVTLKSAKV